MLSTCRFTVCENSESLRGISLLLSVVKTGRVFRPGGRTGQTAIPVWWRPSGICTGVWHFTPFIVDDLRQMSDKETIPQPVPWELYDENALHVIEHGVFTSIPPGEMEK